MFRNVGEELLRYSLKQKRQSAIGRGVRYIDKPYQISIYQHFLKILISMSLRSLLKILISISIRPFLKISISIMTLLNIEILILIVDILKTLQELLSSVTLNCQVTKIVVNSGCQLSEL